MLSFWEKKEFIQYDYCVVGAGITGLSAACELAEREPGAKILVLERGLLPTGASTKNAGFACIGSLSEKVYDLRLMGEEKFLRLIENRWKGLLILRSRLGDKQIDYQSNGGYELVLRGTETAFIDELEAMNKRLQSILAKPVFSVQNELIRKFGLNTDNITQLICNDAEGQIDTGKMMQALWTYAGSLKIKILTGAHVDEVIQHPHAVELLCSNASQKIAFFAAKAVICTNAFTKQLIPGITINPGRGQVVATSPIPGLRLKGIFSFDEGFYYFRNFDERIIFGGGRNLDFQKENTLNFGSNQKILDDLNRHLQINIIPGLPYTIDHQWSGIMAFSDDKQPLVERVGERLAIGVRLNGMGIALGSQVARQLVNLVME